MGCGRSKRENTVPRVHSFLAFLYATSIQTCLISIHSYTYIHITQNHLREKGDITCAQRHHLQVFRFLEVEESEGDNEQREEGQVQVVHLVSGNVPAAQVDA